MSMTCLQSAGGGVMEALLSMVDFSLLEYVGPSRRSGCGYCHGNQAEQAPSAKLGVWADALRNSDYLALLDRGWRRSGRYLYKPFNDSTCCPQFTIRLDTTKFAMSRSQRRCLRQMNEFLATGKQPRCAIREEDRPSERRKANVQEKPASSEPMSSTDRNEAEKTKKAKDVDRPVLKKKEMRRAKFLAKCQEKNLDPEAEKAKRREKEENRRRTIESYISEHKDSWKHNLEVKVVRVDSVECKGRLDESFELYKKYQNQVHSEDDSTFSGYQRFLCDSPLTEEMDATENVELGSMHMWYLLDGKLIAVGVIDVLPRCLSGKYFYYDPDYAFLSLGTYSALREIALTRELCRLNEDLKYYYMGYYIHSCPKMRYKAKFRPSDLLCDRSFKWAPISQCQTRLDASTEKNGYAVFLPNEDPPVPPAIDSIRIYTFQAEPITYATFKASNAFRTSEEFENRLRELAAVAGPVVESLVFYFDALN